LKTIEEKIEEENKNIRRRDWRTEHFSGGEILKRGIMSRSKKVNLIYFIFPFIFYFSIFRITRVRVDLSHCHISHNLMA